MSSENGFRREILISNDQIVGRAQELAKWIDSEYKGKNLLLVCVLLGAIPTTAELMKHITLEDMELDVIRVKSYNGQESNREPELTVDLTTDAKDRHVLVVEDITDTRRTVDFIRKTIGDKGPASLKILSLLRKAERQEVNAEVDVVGFDIPNRWVENFGLDTDGLHRNGPDVTFRNFTS